MLATYRSHASDTGHSERPMHYESRGLAAQSFEYKINAILQLIARLLWAMKRKRSNYPRKKHLSGKNISIKKKIGYRISSFFISIPYLSRERYSERLGASQGVALLERQHAIPQALV